MLEIMRTVPRIKGENGVGMEKVAIAESAERQKGELKGFLSLSGRIDVEPSF